MVCFNVPATSGLASLLKPIWVSLICRNSGSAGRLFRRGLRQRHRRQNAAGQGEKRARAAKGQTFERAAARGIEIVWSFRTSNVWFRGLYRRGRSIYSRR